MAQIPEANPAPPLLVLLSGPSGVGKDAAIGELKKLDRPWHFAITATTRPMRPGEQDGVDYVFLDIDTFHKMRERDEAAMKEGIKNCAYHNVSWIFY